MWNIFLDIHRQLKVASNISGTREKYPLWNCKLIDYDFLLIFVHFPDYMTGL